MITAVLQILVAVLRLAFGVVALQVAGGRRPGDPRALAWLLVGMSTTSSSVIGLAQSVWAAAAVRAGAGTPVYEAYLRWAPAMNYSRHAMMILLAGLLCALPWLARGAERGRTRLVGLGLLAAAGLGAWAGVVEGPLQSGRHFSVTAVLDWMEMMLLFAALLAALVHGWMDRWLWTILAIYAVRQPLNVIYLSGLSRRASGEWAPSPSHLQWVSVATWCVLLSLAACRLWLARRGRGTGAVLDA